MSVPRHKYVSKSGRRQTIILCAACGLEVYACNACGNADIGRFHWACRPKWWNCRHRHRAGTPQWEFENSWGHAQKRQGDIFAHVTARVRKSPRVELAEHQAAQLEWAQKHGYTK